MDYNKLVCLCGDYPNAKPIRESAQGKIVTSSQAVAYYFGKRHDHVISSIRGILNFKETQGGIPKNGETLKNGSMNTNTPMSRTTKPTQLSL